MKEALHRIYTKKMNINCNHKFTDQYGYYNPQCVCGLYYTDFTKGFNNTDEVAMVVAINVYRAYYKLLPMEIDPILMQVARNRVCIRGLTHKANGMWVWDEAEKTGYKGFCTENIAVGYNTGVDAVGTNESGWGDTRKGHNIGHADQMQGKFKVNGSFRNYCFNQLGVGSNPEKKQYVAIFGTLDPPQITLSDYILEQYPIVGLEPKCIK